MPLFTNCSAPENGVFVLKAKTAVAQSATLQARQTAVQSDLYFRADLFLGRSMETRGYYAHFFLRKMTLKNLTTRKTEKPKKVRKTREYLKHPIMG